MEIVAIDNGSVTVTLDPGICLAIAEACWAAADSATEENMPERAGMWTALHGLFESWALLGAAKPFLPRAQELAGWSVARAREDWGLLPDQPAVQR